jgi:hypothetical protein
MRDDEADEMNMSQQIREALANGSELTIGEIFARCENITTTSLVASVLYTERSAGRVTRSGERGAYRYKLTGDGHAAASNPRLLRGRSTRRRPDGIRPPPPPTPAPDPAPTTTPTATTAAEDSAAHVRELVDRHGTPPPATAASRQAGVSRVVSRDGTRMSAAVVVFWPVDSEIPQPLLDLIRSISGGAHAQG